jgi:hypothetical protein
LSLTEALTLKVAFAAIDLDRPEPDAGRSFSVPRPDT